MKLFVVMSAFAGLLLLNSGCGGGDSGGGGGGGGGKITNCEELQPVLKDQFNSSTQKIVKAQNKAEGEKELGIITIACEKLKKLEKPLKCNFNVKGEDKPEKNSHSADGYKILCDDIIQKIRQHISENLK